MNSRSLQNETQPQSEPAKFVLDLSLRVRSTDRPGCASRYLYACDRGAMLISVFRIDIGGARALRCKLAFEPLRGGHYNTGVPSVKDATKEHLHGGV